MSDPGTLIIIGSGPGIGVSVARHFATKTFRTIALLARRETQLEKDKKPILDVAPDTTVETYVVDVGDLTALKKTLTRIETLGMVGCVIFNAARVQPSQLLETDMSVLEEDFRITNLALYETVCWAMPLFRKSKIQNPSIFVTNSMLYKKPKAWCFSLSLVKCGQRNMIMSLNDEFGKEVHFGVVSIEGTVAPDDPKMSPDFIAGKFWELYSQPKEKWTMDMEVLE